MKIDLKDAYFSIPISPLHRKYLCFTVGNKTYQFTCLPFGLASAPWVFTKPVAALGRELGIRMRIYIDDNESMEKARDQASGLVYLLQCLGFTINKEKTILEPSDFLGFTVNTIAMELSLPPEKLKKIRAESRKLLEAGQVSARALSRLIGKMSAANQVSPAVLQTPPNGPGKSLRPGLRLHSYPLSTQQGRTVVVGQPDDKMEWKDNTDNRTRPDHRIRCVEPRMGSILPGHQHRWPMVKTRENPAHKLPRVTSSHISSKNLCEGQERVISITEDRQHNNSCLSWGNSIQGACLPNARPMDVVSGKEHPHSNTILTRDTEPLRRHGVEIHERSIRLETGSTNICEDQ